jgi:hypothetical protein
MDVVVDSPAATLPVGLELIVLEMYPGLEAVT